MEKTKVGILTFHDSINHGAFYQVYAMQMLLQNNGYDVCVLNYTNKRHKKESLKTLFSSKNPFTLIQSIRKLLSFQSAQKKELRLIPKKNTLIHSEVSEISSKMDYIIFGSDIIWDFALPQLGNDTIYFGDKLYPSKGKVAYAASMGTSDAKFPENLIKLVSKFKSIGVRDDRTYNRIQQEEYGKKPLVKVLDPTLLLTPNKWNNLTPKTTKLKPYILVYAFYVPGNVKKWINEFSKRSQLDVIIVGYKNGVNGSNHCHVGPKKWLELIRDAKYVMTSTFHGTIFSIIFGKQFICIGNKAIDGKVISLLNDLNMYDDAYWHNEDPIEFLEKKLIDKINYSQVFQKLEYLRDHSVNFLKNTLNIKNKDDAK